jgi:RNA polymerase sigma factor (sigma-70 family)
MVRNQLSHSQLDARLDELAQNPGTFQTRALELAAEFDRKGIDLEITDPATWHKSGVPVQQVAIDNQLRADVDQMVIMGREEEARLARRIEFARLRLERLLSEAGLTMADLEHSSSGTGKSTDGQPVLPPRIVRRWTELHALRTEMVERNLYLALINVERYAHTTGGRPDLIQEGAAALYRAVDGFDWRRGLLFRTYAVHWLNQAFRAYLYNFTNTVRVPVYLQKAMRHVNQALERIGDPNASIQEIAQESQLGENLVEMALSSVRSSRSLDAPVRGDEDGASLRDLLGMPANDEGPYTTALEDHTLHESLGGAMERLSDRERLIVNLRFGIDCEREHTLSEVAERLGVSLERVRQIQVRALGKLRTPKLRREVDPFLN